MTQHWSVEAAIAGFDVELLASAMSSLGVARSTFPGVSFTPTKGGKADPSHENRNGIVCTPWLRKLDTAAGSLECFSISSTPTL